MPPVLPRSILVVVFSAALPAMAVRAEVRVDDVTIYGNVSTSTVEAFGPTGYTASDSFTWPADNFATCGTPQIAHCADASGWFVTTPASLTLTLGGFTTAYEHSFIHATNSSTTDGTVHFSITSPTTVSVTYGYTGASNGSAGFSLANTDGFYSAWFVGQFPAPVFPVLLDLPSGNYTLHGSTNIFTNSAGWYPNDWNFSNTITLTADAVTVATPEPGTLALLLTGGAALLCRRRPAC